MRIKIRTIHVFVFIISLVLNGFLISQLSFAEIKSYIQEGEENKIEEKETSNIVQVDYTSAQTRSFDVRPAEQYVILVNRISSDFPVVMIGKYYNYKTGKYTSYFMLNELSRDDGEESAKFTLYTEDKSYGYYSIRFFELTKDVEEKIDEYLGKLRKDSKVEASMVIPSCYGSLRLYLRGIEPPKVVQLDFGWSYLFDIDSAKIYNPVPVMLINGYPGAMVMSYKKAANKNFLSRISISFGIGLKDSEEEKRRWFVGTTIPIAYDFSAVIGLTFNSGDNGATRFSLGFKIGPEILTKVLEALKLTKPTDIL